MPPAVALGVLIASGRVYGTGIVRFLLTSYVELMRGTPILLQLFVIYYGLAAAIKLPAFVAALVGLASVTILKAILGAILIAAAVKILRKG